MACGVLVLTVQLALCSAAIAAAGVGHFPEPDVLRVLVVAGCDALLVVLCVRIVRRPERISNAPTAWFAAAVSWLAFLAASGLSEPSPLSASALQMVPVNALQTVQVVAVALLLSARTAAAVVLASGPVHVVLRQAVAGLDLAQAVDEWVLPTATSLAVLTVLHHLRAGADLTDRLARDTHERDIARAARSNAEIARDEARRIVHDDVITALRAVETGHDAMKVRSQCRDAIAALAGTATPATFEAIAADLKRSAPLTVDIDADRWRHQPPPRVLNALRGAAAEALRNSHRHGGATRATVVLSSSPTHTEVVVEDNGVGLPPGWRAGFGIRESIAGRLTEIGGRASVASSSRAGTRVELVWPDVPESANEADRTAVSVVPQRRVPAITVATICAVTTGYGALRSPGEHPALAVLVAAAVIGGLTLVADNLGRAGRRSILASRPAVLALGIGLCLTTWFGLVAAGDGALLSFRAWVVGSVANVVALAAFDLPVRRVVPIVVAQVATILLFAAHDPTIAPIDPLGSLVTPLVVGGIGLSLGAALRHGERLIVAHSLDLTSQAETETWEQETAEARMRYFARLDEDVVPFLRGVLRGEAADPFTAELLSARCRDDLYVEPVLDVPTRAAVHAARRRGVTVSLRAGRHRPEVAWPALREVLQQTRTGDVVTVLTQLDDLPAMITVVPPLPPDACGLGGRHDASRSLFELSSPEEATSRDRSGTVGMDL